MLLSSLTADELERLAYIEPARPGVQAALAGVCREELANAREDIVYLEETEARLRKDIDDLEAELGP